MKRLLSFMLVFVMLFSLSVPSLAAEGFAISVTADKTQLQKGDTVSLTVSANQTVENVGTFQYQLVYDPAKVSYTSSIKGDAYTGTVIDNVTAGEESYVQFLGLDIVNVEPFTLSAGTIGTATFTVTEEAALEDVISFTLRSQAMVDFDGNKIAVAVPEAPITASVVCGHSWADGVCGTCGTECAHAEYENGACKVCGKANSETSNVPFTVTANGNTCKVEENKTGKFHVIVPYNTAITGVFADGKAVTEVKTYLGAVNYTSSKDGEFTITAKDLSDSCLLSWLVSGKFEEFGATQYNESSTASWLTVNNGTEYDLLIEILPEGIELPGGCEHSWNDATCETPKTCANCGETEGDALGHDWSNLDGDCTRCDEVCTEHTYENGACTNCGKSEPVTDISLFTISVNGEAAPVYAGMTSKNKLRHGTTITGTSLTITTKDGSVITQVKDATKNRITGENYLVTNDTSSITIDLSKCSSTDLVTAKYPTEVNFPFGTDTTIYRLNATVNGASQQIYVEVLCDHENWQEAGCSTPEVCLGCGKFANYPAHKLMGDGQCENCEATVPAISATANGKPVEVAYTTASSNSAYTGVLYLEIYEDSDLQIVKKDAYTNNYTWSQIKAAYQTTTRADGSPGWLDWPAYYKLPLKSDVADLVNMPYFQIRTTGTSYDFIVIGVKSHPDHSYVNGECSICGKAEPKTSNLITKIEISNDKIVTDENGAMTMAMVTGASETIHVSTVLENAEQEATQVVAWFSSDTNVATVADGVVTALNAGTTTITAKAVDASGVAAAAEGEEVLAQFTLTVSDPVVGYTVTMPADVTVVTGETVSVPVVVDNADGSAYNAFDMSFTYDPAVLSLTSTEIEGMTVTDNNGTINVLRYGDDLSVGEAAFTLSFEAIGAGETTVTATAAKVGIAETAHELDAATANLVDDATLVTIGGYTVSLPEEFDGAAVVVPGEDYSFTVKDPNYNYTVTATMGGEEVTVTDNGDGSYTIENVTGNLVISTAKTGKEVSVTLGTDMSGETKANYMTNYTATLAKDAAYSYTVTATIGGEAYTGFTVSGNSYTIPGADITGDIVFTVTKTLIPPSSFSVTFEGNGAGDAKGEASAAVGQDYSFTIEAETGYSYAVTATMGGENVEITEAEGTYTIARVSGNLVITVVKTNELEVQVNSYVDLDAKSLFLVRVTGELAEGKAYAYNGNAMYYSEAYEAWCCLTTVEEGQTLTTEQAAAAVTVIESAYTTLQQTFDVNMSGLVDVNDAQLTYNIYNAYYEDFEVVSMQKFLNADTNADGIVNTQDAAAVVDAIV